MQHNLRKLLNSARQFSLPSVSSVVLALLAFFVASGFNCFGETLYCRVLRSARADKTIFARKWATASQGGLGGVEGDIQLYGFLGGYSHAASDTGHVYWPKRYTASNAPVQYTVVSDPSLVINNVPSEQVDNVINSINSQFPTFESSAAIDGITVTYDTDGTPILNVSTYSAGRIVGNGVSTFDANGTPIVALPDSTGFVPGYEPGIDGTYSPVWYDTHYGGTTAITLSSLNDSSSSVLSYDPETGIYSFDQPNYSAQLSAIYETLLNKKLTIDNIELNVPVPEVTVNVSPPEVNVPAPEVTVNVQPPEVNVPTPEVTVNVPTPEVTVNVDTDNSDIVNTLDQLVNASYSAATTNDFSDFTLTEEEQGLLDIATGWQTNIPILGQGFDIGLDFLIGKIPNMGRSYNLLNFNLWGYPVVCNLEPYRDNILIFRAFALLCELVWFFWTLWHDVMNALKV